MARKKRKGTHQPRRPALALPAHPEQAERGGDHPRATMVRWFVIATIAVAGAGAIFVTAHFRGDRVSPPAKPEIASTSLAPTPAVAKYVGGDACTECHAAQRNAWHGSDHDLAMQSADDKSVLGNFSNAKFTYAGTTSTFFRRDGKFLVNTDGPDGKLADYEIKYTFGVHPLQQYLIDFPGGRKQALSIAWDSRPATAGGQRWFHLYPGQNIKAGDFLHWTAPGQNWNFTCAECHSTDLRKKYDAVSATYATTWSEINVSCEACHGPASNHVAWAKREGQWRGLDATKGLALALDERKGIAWTPVAETGNAKRSSPRVTTRELDVCARCHGRASRISDDYVHGKPLLDTHRFALIDDNLYWDDGQMRDEVYNWGSFEQSRMHAQGVTCSDCHDPHSLKLRAQGNALCAQCHQPAKYDATTHTHHASGTPAAACIACHMPTTTYMVVDPRHDHSMRIPRPEVSAKVGSPSACNNCHRKQTAAWAAEAIGKWTGRPPASYQNFAEALHAGSMGAPGAREALGAVIDSAAQPVFVRASAIERLGHMLTPSTIDTVARALADQDAVVRLSAVEALAHADPATRQRLLVPRLADPVLAVRIEAARALADPHGQDGLSEYERSLFDRALAEYVTVQTYNADRPEGRTSLGNLYAQRGDPAAAIDEYRKATEIDATFVPAYANLADLYRARGEEAEAQKVLQDGLARNPRAGVLEHALGLVFARQKRTAESVRALRAAALQEPGNARFAYVYAVALNDSGQPKEGLAVLEGASKRQPYDRDLLSALAYFTSKAGNRALALGYAKRLRELDPENAEYVRMVDMLEKSVQ